MIVQQEIQRLLQEQFNPVHLEVVNESNQHSVPENSETHFKVTLVSDVFSDLRKVARHQRVYTALSAQLEGPVHALALHTYSAQEWQARETGVPQSPQCLGGSKAEAGE